MLLAHERDLLLHDADASHGKVQRDGEDRLSLRLGGVQKIGQLILSVPLIPDIKRFNPLERRIDEKPQGAAGLEHRAVACVLRQERPLAFAPRLQAGPRTHRVGEETNFHWWDPTAQKCNHENTKTRRTPKS